MFFSVTLYTFHLLLQYDKSDDKETRNEFNEANKFIDRLKK